MRKIFSTILKLLQRKQGRFSTDEAVRRSVNKYQEAYKLLEKYGKTGSKTPFLADDERIRDYFQQI